MSLRCEVAVKRMLPLFRSLVAKELVNKYGLSQVDVAGRMGITQAAVSQYLYTKRGKSEIKQFDLRNKIDEIARKTAKEIFEKKISAKDAMNMACKLCTEIRTNEKDTDIQI